MRPWASQLRSLDISVLGWKMVTMVCPPPRVHVGSKWGFTCKGLSTVAGAGWALSQQQLLLALVPQVVICFTVFAGDKNSFWLFVRLILTPFIFHMAFITCHDLNGPWFKLFLLGHFPGYASYIIIQKLTFILESAKWFYTFVAKMQATLWRSILYCKKPKKILNTDWFSF